MEFNAFLNALKNALVERGIESSSAQRHVTALARTFTESDIKEIQQYKSVSEFSELADNLASAIKKRTAAKNAAQAAATAPQAMTGAPQKSSGQMTKQSQQAPKKEEPVPQHTASTAPIPVVDSPRRAPQQPPRAPSTPIDTAHRRQTPPPQPPRRRPAKPAPKDDIEAMEIHENGQRIFWIAFACLSPVLLFLAILFFGIFGFMYGAVALSIAFCVVAVIFLVAAGSAVSLIGLIYGIIRIFSVPAEGFYEIGLAVVVIGLVTLCSILLYNLALRFIPRLFKLIHKFFLFSVAKIKELYRYIKKECYKL